MEKRRGKLVHYVDEKDYTGVTVDRIQLMTLVEEEPMKVGHTYPNKEVVLIRISEEANQSGSMVTISRSCSKRVIATGAKDVHQFGIKVLYSELDCWKVIECDTYLEPIPTAKIDGMEDDEEDMNNETEIVGKQGNADEVEDDDDDVGDTGVDNDDDAENTGK